MATLTITLDPELLEAAKLEAERRHITLDELIADKIRGISRSRTTPAEREALIALMHQGPLGDLGPLPTRDEIYEERTKWPRS
jgi:hypothetical protein